MSRLGPWSVFATLVVVAAADPAAPPLRDPTRPVAAAMAEGDRVNLERNLRWMLARERAGRRLARVGVYADAGVWHPGARSVVELLEKEGVACRVLDRSLMRRDVLRELEALVIPGGWAPLIWASAGEDGLAAINRFTKDGGRVIGVCAGAYLLAKTVRYDGKDYPYPVGLYDGVAEGPVKGLEPFPRPGSAKLTVTGAGEKAGLTSLTAYYSGGPMFHGGSRSTVLARYHDGTAAIVSRPYGRGVVFLCGAHLERPALGGDDAPPPDAAGPLLRALVVPTPR